MSNTILRAARFLGAGLTLGLLAVGAAEAVAGQSAGGRDAVPADAYADSTAVILHRAAQANWRMIDETVVRYTAVIKHRTAAFLRTPLRDRTLYREESAARVFWDRDGETLVQMLGLRRQGPSGRVEPGERHGLSAEAFDPAGDRLFFGFGDEERDYGEAGGDDFWFEHPLAEDATAGYRFRTGDTLTLSFPDGRRLEAVELQVVPREVDVHRLSGSLWIEPGSGALVRAVYRLSDTFDAMRDVPELREEEEDDLRWVPGFLKPWTFDLSMVVVNYALWDFEVWLPYSMRAEGRAAAGVLKFPAEMELSYRMESVVTEKDLAAEEAGREPVGVREERTFRTRAEAMAYLAELASGEAEDVRFVPDHRSTREDGREVRYLLPADSTYLARSPHLPPAVGHDAPGFTSEDEVEEMFDVLADLPTPSRTTRSAWAANWGPQRPDLLRYNRVEGPSVGARLQVRTGSPVGPLSLSLESFLGLADLEPKAHFAVTRESLRNKLTLGVYRELQPVSRRGRHLGIGNSATSLLWGRDDGEYFLATGVDLTLTPPSAHREWFLARVYAERHESVEKHSDFTVAHAFDGAWDFRPNIVASGHDEVGAEVSLRPWWGTDPLAPQAGMELYGQIAGREGDQPYVRGSLLLRGSVPFRIGDGTYRAGLEVEGGRSWGGAPPQREWYLGSATSLRGYDASTLHGASFGRLRAEVSRAFSVVSVGVFGDGGWTGERPSAFRWDDALFSVGLGASVLDGLIRLDVARGLKAPEQTRVDFYLDAPF